MPEASATDKQAERDPEAEARRKKTERIEQNRQKLLRDVATSTTNDLRAKVAYVLNHFPTARDSNVTLSHLVLQTFYPEYIDGDRVYLKDMYRLPRAETITRTRATIQNTYGLFQPRDEIARYRRGHRDATQRKLIADRPGLPVISIHADESGKTQRF